MNSTVARAMCGIYARDFIRYFAASVLALVVDMLTLLVAATVMHYLWAATLGFIAGAIVSYLLCVRFVFWHRRMRQWPAREFGAYALIGVTGLGINNMVIFLAVNATALSLPLAKASAACATFTFNYGLRKLILFRR